MGCSGTLRSFKAILLEEKSPNRKAEAFLMIVEWKISERAT